MSRPFIPVPNCASVELVIQLNSALAENVLHVSKATPYSAADLVAVRNIVDAWDNSVWKSTRHNAASLFRITSKALDSLGSPYDDYTLPTARLGTGGASQPNSVSWAIKKATGLTGRSYRGRLYLIGVPTGALQTGSQLISTTFATNVITYLTTLKTNLAAAGHTLGVVSYRNNGAWRTTGVFTPLLSWVYTDLIVDSQRRRLPGRGV